MIKTLYEIFQHWSAKGSVYLLSDLHLDDDDCLLMDPDWIPPEEQIWIINNKVQAAMGDRRGNGYGDHPPMEP